MGLGMKSGVSGKRNSRYPASMPPLWGKDIPEAQTVLLREVTYSAISSNSQDQNHGRMFGKPWGPFSSVSVYGV